MLIIKDINITNNNKSYVDGKYYFSLENNSITFILNTHYSFNRNKFFESHTYCKKSNFRTLKKRVVESESQKRRCMLYV